jgi:hypothetical protein
LCNRDSPSAADAVEERGCKNVGHDQNL